VAIGAPRAAAGRGGTAGEPPLGCTAAV